MKTIKFITPKALQKYILKEYYIWSGISPYYVPLFGTFFWKRLKNIIKLVLKIDFKSNKKFKNILDIGCGIGIFSLNLGKNLPNTKIIGIDLLPLNGNRFIIQLFNKFNVEFRISTHDIQKKTEYPNEYFDLISALDVLEHVRNPKIALDEIKRILRNDGKLIITVPVESKLLKCLRLLYSKISKKKVIEDHWLGEISSFQEFNKLIKKEFKVELFKYYPFWKLPSIFAYGILYLLSKK
ncbi:MAG: class I SAM-dependent methyltransferase [Promethearchaeota archaeon]